MNNKVAVGIIGVAFFASYGVAYAFGHINGYGKSTKKAVSICSDAVETWIKSEDGKDFMRHYILMHELPDFAKRVGTPEAKELYEEIVNDYSKLATDACAKQTVDEAEHILKNLGKEN